MRMEQILIESSINYMGVRINLHIYYSVLIQRDIKRDIFMLLLRKLHFDINFWITLERLN